MDWRNISQLNLLSENFMQENKNNLFWPLVFSHQKLKVNFIKEMVNEFNWNKNIWYLISLHQILDNKFIRFFSDKVDWDNIIWKQKLNEEIIEEFQDFIDFEYLSEFQKLSEEFLERHEDYVYVDKVTSRGLPYNNNGVIDYSAQHQLSYSFVVKNKNFVTWEGICAFQDFNENEWENLKNICIYFPWNYLFKYQKKNFSKPFLIKYLQNVKIDIKNIALNRYVIEQIGEKYKIPNEITKIIQYCIN